MYKVNLTARATLNPYGARQGKKEAGKQGLRQISQGCARL